ncbi:putative CCR4-NOT transcription complex, subunit 7 [Monocercomonoides exilis]|uniref:putative CCR4-NOT transcription complex, subunit 7 n=1 Tax=Monocercomonoides exilis TaxID=2049356 RepID=UPI003559B003|nr:putative CCR4-NOT transcription complex, subunit 7 [Monocercomonoides exilis]|eukprot:MONOS_481.1-p1 / transcript=MONOS_481.1 / gene=MONOS_481 / organism=Monocercomonoides_exilis_PA203 / gene_product=CCR4-NOT transcription complex, subunit 7, isoform CRA_a / transcript_product=CCR4-NOT transcription complex, subunit 7, isoform CRA_a / location=Mono_scaffold00007:263699-266139(-) / protein_length=785 / sequence_SO=supercontig / SO=protein_coding / is_pseudo=false
MISGHSDQIVDVWAHNVDKEFERIKKLLPKYPVVAMDTEFPGEVYRPAPSTNKNVSYERLKRNVNQLKLIQLGITLGNEKGELPEGTSTWQFNFKFNPTEDRGAENSISMLIKAGINFDQFARGGIDVHYFADLLTTSGLVLNDEVTWLTFHSSSDYGYLVKLLTNVPLPPTQPKFVSTMKLFFPRTYDLKLVAHTRRSLNYLADELSVARVGQMHQAGSDSLLTYDAYFCVVKLFNNGNLDVEGMCGKVGGLNEDGVILYDSLMGYWMAVKMKEFEDRKERRRRRKESANRRKAAMISSESRSEDDHFKHKNEKEIKDGKIGSEFDKKHQSIDEHNESSRMSNSRDGIGEETGEYNESEDQMEDDTDQSFNEVKARDEFLSMLNRYQMNGMFFVMPTSPDQIDGMHLSYSSSPVPPIGHYGGFLMGGEEDTGMRSAEWMGMGGAEGTNGYENVMMGGMMYGGEQAMIGSTSSSPTPIGVHPSQQYVDAGMTAHLQGSVMPPMISYSPSPSPLGHQSTTMGVAYDPTTMQTVQTGLSHHMYSQPGMQMAPMGISPPPQHPHYHQGSSYASPAYAGQYNPYPSPSPPINMPPPPPSSSSSVTGMAASSASTAMPISLTSSSVVPSIAMPAGASVATSITSATTSATATSPSSVLLPSGVQRTLSGASHQAKFHHPQSLAATAPPFIPSYVASSNSVIGSTSSASTTISPLSLTSSSSSTASSSSSSSSSSSLTASASAISASASSFVSHQSPMSISPSPYSGVSVAQSGSIKAEANVGSSSEPRQT